MKIRLKQTEPKDLDYVITAERKAENRKYVGQWDKAQHVAALDNPELGHYILERLTDLKQVGYIILAGIGSKDQSIEFRRLVVTEKGKGYGKNSLDLVKSFAFENLEANRLWLDVREHNQRALNLYLMMGFTREGLLRECVRVDDHFESLIVLSILKSEYTGV
jgi:RimJ/RimL family protein N-acetyltransferase